MWYDVRAGVGSKLISKLKVKNETIKQKSLFVDDKQLN